MEGARNPAAQGTEGSHSQLREDKTQKTSSPGQREQRRGAAPAAGSLQPRQLRSQNYSLGQNCGHPSIKPSCCVTLSKCLHLTVLGSCSTKQLPWVPTEGVMDRERGL